MENLNQVIHVYIGAGRSLNYSNPTPSPSTIITHVYPASLIIINTTYNNNNMIYKKYTHHHIYICRKGLRQMDQTITKHYIVRQGQNNNEHK